MNFFTLPTLPKKTSARLQGITLAETVVYIAVLGIVFVAVADSITTFYESNRQMLEQVGQIDTARKGIIALVAGIREANYSESGSYPIDAAGDNSITYYADYDNDNTVERVRYFLSGNDFQRGIIEPAGNPPVYNPADETVSTLARYIRNAEQGVNIFQYYDTNGALMSSPYAIVNIRYVKINLIVNVDPATFPNEFTVRSSAALRNVKSNL